MAKNFKKTGLKYYLSLLRIIFFSIVMPLVLLDYISMQQTFSIVQFIVLAVVVFFIICAAVVPFFTDLVEISKFLKALIYSRKVYDPNMISYFTNQKLYFLLTKLRGVWNERIKELENLKFENQMVFANIPDPIFIMDNRLNILKTNSIAQDVFGSQINGRNIEDIINSKILISSLHLCLHEKRGKKVEVHYDNDRVFLAKAELVYNQHFDRSRVVLIMDDISEIKRAEKSFSDFIANSSHEIKTPLTSIIGISETIVSSNYEDKELLANFMPTVVNESKRMSVLVNDLLVLASLERQVGEVPTELISVGEVIEGVMNQISWMIKDSKNTIQIDKSDEALSVLADTAQLTQVIYNLITNAIKYGYKGCMITISYGVLKEVPDKYSNIIKPHKMVYISVEDEGDGIPKEFIPRLTERFFRIDDSRSKKVSGTGLGLSIVQQIINRHRGYLDIESKPNIGSKFTILLPALEENY